jgi:5-hydroxyisourate hydrolase-like protein (transthyretin family)
VAASKRPTPATSPSAKPTPTATPTPVATPTPTPTPTETAPVPGDSITISVSDATATPGGTVTAYGRLATADGDPIAGVDVWLLERVAGGSGASEVASATTGADGTVSITTPPLTRSVRLRLVTDTKVDSAAIAVIVEPTVTVTVTPEGETSSVRIDTTGGDPGDTVNVEIRRAGGWQRFVSTQLDGDGGATIGVTNPQQRADHYRAVLPMTAGHGYAETRFSVARQ